VIQNIENEDECTDIEKKEGSLGPKSHSPLEVEVLAIERTERRTDDLRRDTRGRWKPLAIRSGDIKGTIEKLLR
jgi:hypothetical protein